MPTRSIPESQQLWQEPSCTSSKCGGNHIGMCRLAWQCRGHSFQLGEEERPLIMGVLNVTPDSFSDGGRFIDRDRAVERGLQMVNDGADIIDIGGESTRPGARPVPADEELSRVIPVIEGLSKEADIVLSVDTMKADVAECALEAGAHIVNDVSAMTADPRIADVVKTFGAGAILMHMQGEPRTMQHLPQYDNVVRDVCDYLKLRIDALVKFGIDLETLAVDPGIGFGKTAEHNIQLIGHLSAFSDCGRPIVIGLSRKRFLGDLTGQEVGDRLAGSIGAMAYSLVQGVHVVRVHDVKESRDAARVVNKLILESRNHALVEQDTVS